MAKDFPLNVETLVSVFDYLNVGVYVTDLDRRILLWNRKAEEITGHKREDIVGKHCRDNILCHVDKDGRKLCSSSFCPLYRAIHTGQESSTPIIVYALKNNGSRIAVSVSVAPLRDSSGGVIGGIEVFRDETAFLHDLEFAKTIQRNLLTQAFPKSQTVQIDVRYYPHDMVGGDFYDVRQLKGGRCAVLVADVRGHGVSAALYTMWLKSATDSLSELADDPARFITGMNRELSRIIVEESFATAFYAVVEKSGASLSYCCAGHPAPLLYHSRAASTSELSGSGLPLGISPNAEYETAVAPLENGDIVLCYTDGITEATDKRGRLLGVYGLSRVLESETKAGRAKLLDRVYNGMIEASGTVGASDDILLLSITSQTQ